MKNLIHRYLTGNKKAQKEEAIEEIPVPDELQTEEPSEDVCSLDDLQNKLMEVTRTLQTLQFAVKQFRNQGPKVRCTLAYTLVFEAGRLNMLYSGIIF